MPPGPITELIYSRKTGQNRSEVLNKTCHRRLDEDFPATRGHDFDVWHHLCPVDQGSTAGAAEDARWKAEFVRAGATFGRRRAGPVGSLESAKWISQGPRERYKR